MDITIFKITKPESRMTSICGEHGLENKDQYNCCVEKRTSNMCCIIKSERIHGWNGMGCNGMGWARMGWGGVDTNYQKNLHIYVHQLKKAEFSQRGKFSTIRQVL